MTYLSSCSLLSICFGTIVSSLISVPPPSFRNRCLCFWYSLSKSPSKLSPAIIVVQDEIGLSLRESRRDDRAVVDVDAEDRCSGVEAFEGALPLGGALLSAGDPERSLLDLAVPTGWTGVLCCSDIDGS